jgi:hypothetical protein
MTGRYIDSSQSSKDDLDAPIIEIPFSAFTPRPDHTPLDVANVWSHASQRSRTVKAHFIELYM